MHLFVAGECVTYPYARDLPVAKCIAHGPTGYSIDVTISTQEVI
jgi:hypothetical protein